MNTKPQHTPGPWKFVTVLGSTDNALQIRSANSSVGIVHGSNLASGRTYEESFANSCLIAAAPDLLAACEALIDFAKDCGLDDDDAAMIEQAVAAIDKARGGAA